MESHIVRMEPIVLFAKSYLPDLLRAKRLAHSIVQFNRDRIPFFLSVPVAEMGVFRKHLSGYSVNLIADEQVLDCTSQAIANNGSKVDNIPEHLFQQMVKAEFWRLGVCTNYVVLDSDSFFIKPFFKKDFLWSEDIPLTVMHEGKDFLQFAARHGMKKLIKDYRQDRLLFHRLFATSGPLWDFGPTPVIWSSKVWQGLNDAFAASQNTHVVDLIRRHPCELLWYGHYLVSSDIIPIIPIEPLFKCYHYRQQYEESQRLGETESVLAENFLGVVMQSNWDRTLSRDKGISFSNLLNKIRALFPKRR